MRTLGGTGIKVSPYCLGAMMFGAWGNPDHEESIRIIHAALDAGINFVDTADVYSAGESEEIVGQALRGRRDDVVLATKAHGAMGQDVNMAGNSRRWIIREVENSLRRLQTDYIDLYQMHRPDPDTDIDETLSALSDLVHSGKVRAIGSSTFPAEQIVEAQWVADRRGYVRFRCEQPPYSMLVRGIEGAVLPACQKYGMGVIAWSPLAGGWLTGRIRQDTGVDMTRGRARRLPNRFDPALPGNQAKLAAVEELIKIAADAGCSLTHMALGVRDRESGGDLGDHRPANDGAAYGPAGRRERHARRRRARPDRPDRPARRDPEPRRRGLAAVRARRPRRPPSPPGHPLGQLRPGFPGSPPVKVRVMWRRRHGADVRSRVRPDEQHRAGGMIHDEPGGPAQALGAEPGPVAVTRHDEQVRVGGGCHHGPFGMILNFQPFARPPESARGRLHQVGGCLGGHLIEPRAGVAPAPPEQPQVGAARGAGRGP